jgi:nucleoid DNA-binding protein
MANGKQTVQDWAEGLSRRSKISRAKSDSFLRAFFSLIKKGLAEENFVKIKGLGTFKLVPVSSRESIDVNTGQRIEIGEHQRLLFTPDKTMKERVNRPFEQFDTIVIEDDALDLGAIDRQAAEYEQKVEAGAVEVAGNDEQQATEPEPQQTEPELQQEKEKKSIIPVPKIPQPATSGQPVSPGPPAEGGKTADSRLEIQSLSLTEPDEEKTVEEEEPSEPAVTGSEAPDQEPTPAEPEPAEGEEEQEPTHRHRYLVVALVIAGFIIIGAGCYLMGYFHIFGQPGAKVEAVAQKVPVAPPVRKPVAVKPKPKVEKKSENTPKQEDVVELSKKYKQLPGGKFLIVGTLETHRMKVGDNLLRLSRKIFGSKNYVDYIIFYNDLKNPDVVPLGTDIKIPRLAHKPDYDKERQ